MAKKEFSWDKETAIGMVEISEKEKRKVCICELNSKEFVAVQKIVKVKEEWKIVANSTFPIQAFEEIAKIVENHLHKEEK